jgi:hypothetical protein
MLDTRFKKRRIYIHSKSKSALIVIDNEMRFTTAPNNFVYGDGFPKEVIDTKLTDGEKSMVMEVIFTDFCKVF